MNSILLAIAVLGGMGALFGLILAVAAKVFYVEVDPKQEAVRECLAGANCGGCGYPGCAGCAGRTGRRPPPAGPGSPQGPRGWYPPPS